jgi:hypothetical protein
MSIADTFAQKFNKLGYAVPRATLDNYDLIANRFGESPPHGGVVFKAPCVWSQDTLFIDVYGRGCIHNSEGNPYRADLQRRGLWNRPIPFPSDLTLIFKALQTVKAMRRVGANFKIQLGLKSEPFPWSDRRYGFTLEVVRMLQTFGLEYSIFTASDLIAYGLKPDRTNDTPIDTASYCELIDKKLATIIMRIPNLSEETLRQIEPGAPSRKRRAEACASLMGAGYNVILETRFDWDRVTETKQTNE